MPVIMPNGDVCDDEEIYGSNIYCYDSEDEHDCDDDYEDPVCSELIDRFEFRLALTSC